MMGKLHTKFTRHPGKPLRPTPMSFLRPASPPSRSGPTYSSFQAFYLPGRHKSQIAKGFEPRYPADIMVDHDVSAVDWDRFLLNLQVAGALRGRDQLIANVLPASLTIVNAGIGNYWITRGIMNSLQRRYIPEVLALVETYQYRFFQQRELDVFVACGTSRMTGDLDQDEDLKRVPGEQERQIKEAERSEQVSNKSMSEMDPGYYATTDARLKSYKIDKKRLKEERREKKKEERQKRCEMRKEERQKRHEMRKEERQKRHEMRKEERQARSNDKKHGKYRIVIEPMEKPIVQPSAEWLLQLEEREKGWGYSGNTISGAEVRVNSQ
ncbi:hypothetical protein MPSI1_002270 [Malassezia psittaci]|uniref:Uncharacterized protein n=1 Tax=Malassezia psittaci TaxID=1821823 RepID=A0AAF0FAA3_9BASI|nr:hypothetical protein MPSI1_002270 [Malassezia psittaci]